MSVDSRPRARRQGLRGGAPVFISWIGYHGRSAGLAEDIGAEAYFFDGGRPSWPVALRYVVNSLLTVRLLVRARPRAVLVMLPPLPLLVLAKLWSAVTGASLVGDLHSAVFNDGQWLWATRPTMRLLASGHAVVTNEPLAQSCRDAGVPALVLHDSLGDVAAQPPPPAPGAAIVLAPLSYATDEPLTAILGAAAAHDGLRWVLTGKAPAEVRREAPANVEFPGHIPNEDYARLMDSATVVLALTTREHTLQRAGYEAANAGKLLVASATGALREFFEDGAVYAEPTAESIAAAVTAALDRGPELTTRIREVQSRRRQEQRAALEQLRALVGTAEA